MKKLLILLGTLCTAPAWASHHFTVCYYNWTSSPVSYNNDGISYKWKNRGELTGVGSVNANQSKCFSGITDETMIFTHYITFTVGDKWYGIANPGFSRPFVIAQDGTSTKRKDGLLTKTVDSGGHEDFSLNIHFQKDGSVVLSNAGDPKDNSQYITPRKYKYQ
jgi:hypothetical protein